MPRCGNFWHAIVTLGALCANFGATLGSLLVYEGAFGDTLVLLCRHLGGTLGIFG